MVIATGFFDGVHIGHRFVIERLVSAARERGDQSMVVTFWPHPRNVLQDDARNLRLLTSLEEKKALLKGLGVDHVEVLPFTKEFSRLTTREYFRDVLVARFGAKAVLIGYDNRMGCDPQTPESIERIAVGEGIDVVRLGSVTSPSGVTVSSTKIREAVAAGEMETAAAMLGYEYSLLGVVVAGNRLGRTIGFPTANIQLYEPLKLLPGNGVYSVEAETLGRKFKGMCNIGVRPTVRADLKVTFHHKIRDERRFDSIDTLRSQLAADKASILDKTHKRDNAEIKKLF